MHKVELYTDGACSGNPGVGGWGAILIWGEKELVLSGYDKQTTNNRMEMFAIVEGLRALKTHCNVTVYSDSAYVVNAFNEKWIDNWQKNNWKNSQKDKVKNEDLWRLLIMETNKHTVKFVKVKGHADNVNNNRCDELATGEIKKYIELGAVDAE